MRELPGSKSYDNLSPVNQIWKLQMPADHKAGISCMFLLGALYVVRP